MDVQIEPKRSIDGEETYTPGRLGRGGAGFLGRLPLPEAGIKSFQIDSPFRGTNKLFCH